METSDARPRPLKSKRVERNAGRKTRDFAALTTDEGVRTRLSAVLPTSAEAPSGLCFALCTYGLGVFIFSFYFPSDVSAFSNFVGAHVPVAFIVREKKDNKPTYALVTPGRGSITNLGLHQCGRAAKLHRALKLPGRGRGAERC